jgi:26S proteasome regulatory subunit N8
VVEGTLPVNHEILGHLQDSFNLLPNLNLEAGLEKHVCYVICRVLNPSRLTCGCMGCLAGVLTPRKSFTRPHPEDYVKSFAVKTNDMMLVIYLSSLIRSVIALHNLINNKAVNKAGWCKLKPALTASALVLGHA